MGKVNQDFVKQSFEGAIGNYKNAAEEVGLWKSEEYIFNRCFEKDKAMIE